jgi:hypothetical protein
MKQGLAIKLGGIGVSFKGRSSRKFIFLDSRLLESNYLYMSLIICRVFKAMKRYLRPMIKAQRKLNEKMQKIKRVSFRRIRLVGFKAKIGEISIKSVKQRVLNAFACNLERN